MTANLSTLRRWCTLAALALTGLAGHSVALAQSDVALQDSALLPGAQAGPHLARWQFGDVVVLQAQAPGVAVVADQQQGHAPLVVGLQGRGQQGLQLQPGRYDPGSGATVRDRTYPPDAQSEC